MTNELPFSAPCERNKDVILDVLTPYLSKLDRVLEIGSGSGQHAVHFARANPHLLWQTSDQLSYIDGVQAQLKHANVSNALAPLVIDVNQADWLNSESLYSAVYTANTLHIMTKDDVLAFFHGLPKVVKPDCLLFIYGPFKYAGQFTSESNYEFDQSLRSRGCGSGIKDIEIILELASQAGFGLLQDNKMPANNQLLVFKHKKQ